MSGVPVYQLMAYIIAVAAVLLLAVIYAPLMVQREVPRWVTMGAVGASLVLVGGVTFAAFNGHWPLG